MLREPVSILASPERALSQRPSESSEDDALLVVKLPFVVLIARINTNYIKIEVQNKSK